MFNLNDRLKTEKYETLCAIAADIAETQAGKWERGDELKDEKFLFWRDMVVDVVKEIDRRVAGHYNGECEL